MNDIQELYKIRFQATGLEKRRAVWRVLTRSFFQKFILPGSTVLDIACGYGEFINNIDAERKYAVDVNLDAARYLDEDVQFFLTSATDLSALPKGQIDVAFTSNFLEHFRRKEELDAFLRALHGVLKPGGRFIIMGPNIRYAFKEYWDFYDHYLPLSHASLAEALSIAGFATERVIGRFLPYTMNNAAPTAGFIIKAYLRMPFAWRFFGKQFLVVARKPVT